MQYPTNWYKRTGGYIYELANGTTHDLVSFSPIIANQTAAIICSKYSIFVGTIRLPQR